MIRIRAPLSCTARAEKLVPALQVLKHSQFVSGHRFSGAASADRLLPALAAANAIADEMSFSADSEGRLRLTASQNA